MLYTHACMSGVYVCLQMLVQGAYYSLECLLSYNFPLFHGCLLDKNFHLAEVFIFSLSFFFLYRSCTESLIFFLFFGILWAGLLFQEHSFLSVLWNGVCKWMMMVVKRGRRKDAFACLFFFLVCWILNSPLFLLSF